MTRTTLIGTAALLSILGATPVLAQHMIEEPGAFAFYNPYGDLAGNAPPTRTVAPNAYASTVMRAGQLMGPNVVVTKRRHRK